MLRVRFLLLAMGACALLAPAALADRDFEKLQTEVTMAAFSTEAVYENETGHAMGARFRHVPSGFVLDVLRIQSVPQAFMWVNSFPPSDQGEPHTCEHLLLGKGTKGRYVASLEDMSLGSSSAFTMQLQTCYHFHTAAGPDVFYQLMEARLDALLHPNFTDEEIRREVCNMGYAVDHRDSSLQLEEKGTVYNEMVSAFERPWSNLGFALDRMLYGEGHPLSNSSGGYPDAIRTMTPQDLRTFHRENYRLGNMGMVVSVPDEIELPDFLDRLSRIFQTVQPEAELGADPANAEAKLPPPAPAATPGSIEVVSFPHQNSNEPGLLLYAWPPTQTLDNNERYLFDLFMANLAGGETSILYSRFMDSRTRIKDIGASSVFAWVSDDQGSPVYVGFSNVKREATEPAEIAAVRTIIQNEIGQIAEFTDGSPELQEFNERARNRVIERRRSLRKFLNSPPGFGFRGTGARWYHHLKHLGHVAGERKRLTLDDELNFAQELLGQDRNFWREYIERWELLRLEPYAAAAQADPGMLAAGEEAREKRISGYVEELKQRQGTPDEQEAIESYKADYDRQTAAIDEEARQIPMPRFVDNPPLTLDDQLDYTMERLTGAVPLVRSTFENITSGTVGLAFRMDVVPPSDLVYVPALPTLLTEVGMISDGTPIPYDEVTERIRREILSLQAYYSVNHRTERVELVLRAAGSDADESLKAMDWLNTALFTPDWRVENLPRIRDAVDLALKSHRNTMRRSEEAWVWSPANAFWKQSNPLLLSADCFLTRTHALHRVRWLLKGTSSPSVRDDFSAFLQSVAALGKDVGKEQLATLLSQLSGTGDPGSLDAPLPDALRKQFDGLSPEARALADEAIVDLKQSLADIPVASLPTDWNYLCGQMAADAATPPADVLTDFERVMEKLRREDNARAFMIASSTLQGDLTPALTSLVDRLGKRSSARQQYDRRPAITARLRERTPGLERPVYVGLVNENTRSGVFLNSASCASYEDNDPEKLLKFLSARLYGGGGAHSMFMKTWGAGLAYSNGLRSNENTGRMIYYAERCPDLAQTMQFVVGELKNAPYDSSLAEYAIAQAFAVFRAGHRYEQRGEAMAADLADGLTPEDVQRFRQGILALRDSENLYDELQGRMEDTYGEVLPGYGPSEKDIPDAVQFIIGPEAQFQSFEEYLQSTEGDATVHRLYPRDFWLVPSAD